MPPKQTSSDGLPASNRFAILNLLDDVEEENDDDGDDDALSRYGNILQVTESRAYNLRDFGPQISRSLVTRHEPHSQHQREPTKPCENDNLCAYCQSIFMESQKLDRFGDGEEQQHHPNYKSFKEAVEMGCYICSLIGQKLELLVGEPGSTLSASGSVEKQFESLRYWMTHEELEPNVYFNYFDRNGKAHHRVLGLQLLPTSELESILHTTPITKCTSSNHNLGLVRRWLLQCCKEHEECNHWSSTEKKLPTRMISVENVAGRDRIRLCDGADLSQSTSYLTLSHCWGRKPIFTLVQANIERLHEQIEKERLPKVFQDAILMTKRLGYKYIWIDSLCIIQDSMEDWNREAPRMGDVYRNAICNLAATGFHDGQNGLFVSRNERLISPLRIDVRWKGMSQNEQKPLSGLYYLFDSDLWGSSVSNAPLNHRAWVVQERILSPRIVHFGSSQLFWECHQLKASEAFPKGFSYKILTGNNLKRGPLGSDTRESYRYWRGVVQAYSKGRLTFSQDKLSAIAGIAMDLWRSLRDRYLAGHWEGDMIHSLLWMVYQSEDYIGLPSEYRAPTWSWASIDAEINYMNAWRNAEMSQKGANDPEEIIHSTVVEVYPTYFSTNTANLTVQWTLRIQGPLRRAMKIPGHDPIFNFWTVFLPHSRPLTAPAKIEVKLFLDVPVASNKRLADEQSTSTALSAKNEPFIRSEQLDVFAPDIAGLFLLPLRSDWEDLDSFQVEMYGLALYPTGRKRGEFQRIGCFVVEKEDHRNAVLDATELLEEQYFEDTDRSGQYTIMIV